MTTQIAEIIERHVQLIQAEIAVLVREELSHALQVPRLAKAAKARTVKAKPSRKRAAELTKWTADKRARRVPSFVIEKTGLDTKKKIEAKYGEGVTFTKDGPLPKLNGKMAQA